MKRIISTVLEAQNHSEWPRLEFSHINRIVKRSGIKLSGKSSSAKKDEKVWLLKILKSLESYARDKAYLPALPKAKKIRSAIQPLNKAVSKLIPMLRQVAGSFTTKVDNKGHATIEEVSRCVWDDQTKDIMQRLCCDPDNDEISPIDLYWHFLRLGKRLSDALKSVSGPDGGSSGDPFLSDLIQVLHRLWKERAPMKAKAAKHLGSGEYAGGFLDMLVESLTILHELSPTQFKKPSRGSIFQSISAVLNT